MSVLLSWHSNSQGRTSVVASMTPWSTVFGVWCMMLWQIQPYHILHCKVHVFTLTGPNCLISKIFWMIKISKGTTKFTEITVDLYK